MSGWWGRGITDPPWGSSWHCFKTTFWFGLKLYDISWNEKLFSYDPEITWRHYFGCVVEISFLKMLRTKNIDSKSTILSLLISRINYLSKKWSTVSIAHVVQSLWTFPLFHKIYSNYVAILQKVPKWNYLKWSQNDLTEEMGQSVLESTNWNLWKTAFKTSEVIWTISLQIF